MKIFNLIVTGLLLTSYTQLFATDKEKDKTTENTTEETKVEKPVFGGLEISGFVDTYYKVNFGESGVPTSFMEESNSFALGMANIVLSKQMDKVGFVADLAFGPRAEVANGYTGTSLAAIKQLYVTYSPTDKLTFSMGNFSTFVGYELIDSPGNFNYSTSYMFSNGPFYHTGIKADYAISDKLGVMVGVFNETDSKMSFQDPKLYGAQLSFAPNDATAIYVNYLGGNYAATDVDPLTAFSQIDLTATFQATDALLIGVNATNQAATAKLESEDIKASWFGGAVYLNYMFSEAAGIGFRGEYIGDDDALILGGYDTGDAQDMGGSITSFTLSGNINIGDLKLIPEVRYDMASDNVSEFRDGDGMATNSTGFLGLAAIYSF